MDDESPPNSSTSSSAPSTPAAHSGRLQWDQLASAVGLSAAPISGNGPANHFASASSASANGRPPRAQTADVDSWTIRRLRLELAQLGESQHGKIEQLRDRFKAARARQTSGAPTATSPVTSSTASSSAKQNPAFSANEYARLAEVVASPETISELAQAESNPTREELDGGLIQPWATGGVLVTMFNSDTRFERRDDSDAVSEIDPNAHPHFRSGDVIKAKWADARAKFTIIYTRWTASGLPDLFGWLLVLFLLIYFYEYDAGQNDPDTFPNFSQGNAVMEYMFYVFKDNPALESFVLRTIPEADQRDEGLGAASATKSDGPAARKRRKQNQETSSSPVLRVVSELSTEEKQLTNLRQQETAQRIRNGKFDELVALYKLLSQVPQDNNASRPRLQQRINKLEDELFSED